MGIGLAGCQEEVEFTRRPIERAAETAENESIRTHIYVASELDARAIAAAVEARFPEDVTNVKRWLKRAACVERNGNKRCTSALVRGRVFREEPVNLVADGRQLVLSVPLSYEFSAKGSRFAEDRTDEATGTLVLSARYDLDLDKEWRAQIRFKGDYEWDRSPEISILDGELSLGRTVTRRLRNAFRRSVSSLESAMDTEPVVDMLAQAWRTLHYPIKVTSEPKIWIRGEPQAVRFAGVKSTDGRLDVRFGIETSLRSFAGDRPMPLIPLSLPDLSDDGIETTNTELLLAAHLDYSVLEDRVAAVLPEGRQLTYGEGDAQVTFSVSGARMYNAQGRLALAVDLAADIPDRWRSMVGTAHVVASPKVSESRRGLELAFADLTQPSDKPSLHDNGRFVLPKRPLIEAFEQAVRIDVDEAFSDVIATANAVNSRPVGEEFLMTGHFESMRVHSIRPGQDGLRVNLAVVGDLSLRSQAALVPGTVKPTSGEATIE